MESSSLVGAAESPPRLLAAKSSISAKASLALLASSFILGFFSLICAWTAYFNNATRYAPASVSAMTHLRDGAESTLFIGFALAGLLLLFSGFPFQLANVTLCFDGAEQCIQETGDSVRFVGTGVGCFIVAFLRAGGQDKGHLVTAVYSMHVVGSVVLFSSALLPELYLLTRYHPVLSDARNATERKWRLGLVTASLGLSAVFFGVELWRSKHRAGLDGWVLDTVKFIAEVYGGSCVWLLHACYWVFAPERVAQETGVPKSGKPMLLVAGAIWLTFAAYGGLHFQHVCDFAYAMARKRDNCAVEVNYQCVRCKPGVMFDQDSECTRISDDLLFWSEKVLPIVARRFEETRDPAKVFKFTSKDADANAVSLARNAKFLSYHICAKGTHGYTLYRGVYVPDVFRLRDEIEGIEHMFTPGNPLWNDYQHGVWGKDGSARAVMTHPCRWAYSQTGRTAANVNKMMAQAERDSGGIRHAQQSMKGFTCISSGLFKDFSEMRDLKHIGTSLWRMMLSTYGRTSASIMDSMGNTTVDDIPPIMKEVEVKQGIFSDAQYIINDGKGGFTCEDHVRDDDADDDDDGNFAQPWESRISFDDLIDASDPAGIPANIVVSIRRRWQDAVVGQRQARARYLLQRRTEGLGEVAANDVYRQTFKTR